MYVDLYLLKSFSNYFNRKVKRRETLTEYLDGLVEGEDYFILPYTNFNPNDGVSASHIVGSATKPFTPEWQPDYCLVVGGRDGETPPPIYSRWFVTEFVRTMANQYSMALKRDTPADKYDIVKNAPCYIQKATLPNNSPLIVNSEGMNLNQRKVAEYVLRDRSKVPWVICYIEAKNEHLNIPVNVGLPTDIPDLSRDDDPEARYVRELFIRDGTFYTTFEANQLQDLQMVINFGYSYRDLVDYRDYFGKCFFSMGRRDNITQTEPNTELNTLITGPVNTGYLDRTKIGNFSLALATDYNNFYNYLKQYDNHNINRSERVDGALPILTNEKIWKYGDKYYETILNKTEEDIVIYLPSNNNDYLFNKFKENYQEPYTGEKRYSLTNIKITYYRYELREKTGLTATLSITNARHHPEEAPYDIVAFPYGKIYVDGTGWNKDVDDVASLAAGRSIAIELAGGCYDVQILPYCPVLEYIDSDGNINLTGLVEGVDYCAVKKVEEGVTTNYTLGFYCRSAYKKLTENNVINKLYNTITNEEIDVRSVCTLSPDGRKIDNECDVWRLCAPNFTAQFEFKLTKTLDLIQGAEMDHFDVDITYRPYQPYIRVAPQFGFLYVTDYKDARGLICGTGFSITLIDDKWATYELNNKNYQNMFNREIQGMEVNRNIAREQEQWNIANAWTNSVTSLVGGAAKGAATAAFTTGNPYAAIAGAAIGTVTGAIKGGMGIAGAYKQADWAERAYQENRDFKLDMFNMSLDNIKALPSSITQSSSISYNFKFFPVLEKYTCTDEERQMVKDKIKWNGMTVGLIGTISAYISNTEERYIQGQIIRLDGLGEDSHLANDLYNEVNKGLFFEPYLPPNKEVK